VTLVFNASPVIVLAKAGLLKKVFGMASRVIIPQPVADEIARGGDPSDPAALWLNRPESSSCIVNAPPTSGFVAAWDLGAGESSVISLAETIPESTAVLDDLAARRCAEALQLKLVGTLGLLLVAKKMEVIDSIRDSLAAIVDAGLFISPKHLADILKRAGE
jgi:predicted nucleic acid-binding protein